MRFPRAFRLFVAVLAAICASIALAGQAPAGAATADPCLQPGYARVAWGDAGAAGWYRNANYNVEYDNAQNAPTNATDHNLQWELTWSPKGKNAMYCVQNLKAIGRTTVSSAYSYFAGSSVYAGISAPVGAGWVSSGHRYDMSSGDSLLISLEDEWNSGRSQAESDVTLHAYAK
jgi:hypothetical protein